MADDTTTDADEDAATATDERHDSGTDDLGDAGKRAIQEVRREARDAKVRLKAANAELEKFRQSSMTETEKAVAEARTTGATEAAKATAPRLVRAELRAAAAESGLPKESLAGFLEYADLTRFVGDDGEVDDKAITAAIKKLGGGKPADFDGGARTPAPKGNDMNSVIRRAAGVI